jgi:hypothetical protein
MSITGAIVCIGSCVVVTGVEVLGVMISGSSFIGIRV